MSRIIATQKPGLDHMNLGSPATRIAPPTTNTALILKKTSRWSELLVATLNGAKPIVMINFLLLFLLTACGQKDTRQSNTGSDLLKGLVVATDGRPIAAATVQVGRLQTRSNAEGWFSLRLPVEPQWLEVHHPGFLSEVRAVKPGSALLVRLTADDGRTLVVTAVGDVMAGRRFYGSSLPDVVLPQLGPQDGTKQHLALLTQVLPMLQHSDLNIANLETPLSRSALITEGSERSTLLHAGKDYAYASSPALASALRSAGFTVLSLANNHLYDALDSGVASTLDSLRSAGFKDGEGFFGAGLNEQQAWRPAVVHRQGQTIALLGCTSISGFQHEISYVVSKSQQKGGAALCEPNRLFTAIKAAKRHSSSVILMIHGGNEYQREPTSGVQRLITGARQAGATLILNHHPHVLGGFRWDRHTFVATSLGNFLFDQTIWPTFESTLLRLYLRDGKLARVTALPLMLHQYRPYAVVGELANSVARGLSGRQPGPWLVESGLIEADLHGDRQRHSARISLQANQDGGSLWQLPKGVTASWGGGIGRVEWGRDLLWVGSFEDELVGAGKQVGALWGPATADKRPKPEAAYAGQLGMLLQRSPANRSPVVLSPLHRIPVQAGDQLSIIGMARGNPQGSPRLLLSWYTARRGTSQARLPWAMPRLNPNKWSPFRLDVTAPKHTVALGLHFLLNPTRVNRNKINLDNIRIIHWNKASKATANTLYDWIRIKGRSDLELQTEFLPGAEAFVPTPTAEPWPAVQTN
jgi:poly-gamma-glutamate synthesis protein (capsule biosynthesis protein)